jgi:hypothetical protein
MKTLLLYLTLFLLVAHSVGADDTGVTAPAPAPVAAPVVTPEQCILDGLRGVDESLPDIYPQIKAIPIPLIQGKQTPGWNDFDYLNKIIDGVKKGKKSAADSGKLDQIKATLAQIQKSIPDDPALVTLRDANKDRPEATTPPAYMPTEYELKREYQHVLWELNRELPENLKIKTVHIPYDTRKPALIVQAKAMLVNQEKRFDAFFSDTGFSNLDAAKTAISNYDDTAKSLLQAMDTDDVEVAMNRPENARWWVPRVGFENQRTTGSSKGSMNPSFRNQVEAKLTGTDLSTYTATDDQFKPNYGYLKPKPQANLHQDMTATRYGSDVYIFKKDHVADRLTWTAGDSFGVTGYASADPSQLPQNWRGFFVPWKDRALIIPDVLSSIETQQSGFLALPPQPKPQNQSFDTVAMNAALAKLPPVPTAPPAPPLLTYPPLPTQPPQPQLSYSRVNPPAGAPMKQSVRMPNGYPVQASIPLPVAPPPPSPLRVPFLPPLKSGQLFADALTAYQQSDGYKEAQTKQTQQQADYQKAMHDYQSSDAHKKYLADVVASQDEFIEKLKEFQSSDVYKKYLADVAAADAEYEKKLKDYQNSDAYKNYQANQDIDQAKMVAYQQSDAYKQWLKDYATYQTQIQTVQTNYAAATKIYQATPEYQAYLKALNDYNALKAKIATPNDQVQWSNYNMSIDPYFSFQGTSLEPFRGIRSFGYIELQYWGPLNLDDVQTFEFRGSPPSGDFLKELQKRGITIRDGRNDPAVNWTPPAAQ